VFVALHLEVEAGLAIKNPPKKTQPKKPRTTHLKKTTKNVWFFCGGGGVLTFNFL
jgi:hypothetical protein